MSTIKQIQDQVISVFENSSTTLDYAYCNNENDSRGYTSGRSGFTTSDGDALEVIKLYPPMAKFINQLIKLRDKNSSSTLMLRMMGYPSAWKNAANYPSFRAIQDQVNDAEYYTPAIALAAKYGVTSPLGILCFYDSAVQHGLGDDPDSVGAWAPMRIHPGPEDGYLKAFLQARRNDLLNPANSDTKDEWSQSVGRVDALAKLVSDGNMNLTTPFTINPFGDAFVIS